MGESCIRRDHLIKLPRRKPALPRDWKLNSGRQLSERRIRLAHLMQFPRVVIPHRGARVGMGGGFLHISQGDSGVERGSDERVPWGLTCLLIPARRVT
jgi:hypothetical protein